ncbi:MAG TPA: hypothetical protein VI758_08930 [Bacteroidota bacterium]
MNPLHALDWTKSEDTPPNNNLSVMQTVLSVPPIHGSILSGAVRLRAYIVLTILISAVVSGESAGQSLLGVKADFINKPSYGFRVALDAPFSIFEVSPLTTTFVKFKDDGTVRVSLNAILSLPFLAFELTSDSSTTLSLEELAAVLLIVPQSIANSRFRLPFGRKDLLLSAGFNTDLYSFKNVEIYSEFFMGIQWRFSHCAIQIHEAIPLIKVHSLDKRPYTAASVSVYFSAG